MKSFTILPVLLIVGFLQQIENQNETGSDDLTVCLGEHIPLEFDVIVGVRNIDPKPGKEAVMISYAGWSLLLGKPHSVLEENECWKKVYNSIDSGVFASRSRQSPEHAADAGAFIGMGAIVISVDEEVVQELIASIDGDNWEDDGIVCAGLDDAKIYFTQIENVFCWADDPSDLEAFVTTIRNKVDLREDPGKIRTLDKIREFANEKTVFWSHREFQNSTSPRDITSPVAELVNPIVPVDSSAIREISVLNLGSNDDGAVLAKFRLEYMSVSEQFRDLATRRWFDFTPFGEVSNPTKGMNDEAFSVTLELSFSAGEEDESEELTQQRASLFYLRMMMLLGHPIVI